MSDTKRTKDGAGTESWRRGGCPDELGVDVFPPEPSDHRSRYDEVCAWRGHGYSGAALSCTLRQWADQAKPGRHVRDIVRDTLGEDVEHEVDSVVTALLPPKPKSYHVGWDTIAPDPGETELWDCRVCGDACDVKRGVVGQTSMYGAPRLHDKFTCPNAGEPWHDRTLEIRKAIEDMPSPSVRALMEGDVANILKKRSNA